MESADKGLSWVLLAYASWARELLLGEKGGGLYCTFHDLRQ